MNERVFNDLKSDLRAVLKSKFGIEGAAIDILVDKGQSALKSTMLAYITKNGTKEAEDIICSRIETVNSPLRSQAIDALDKGLKGAKELGGNSSEEVAEVSVDTLLNGMRQAFSNSGQTKDTKGICQFLGIDPMMIKMVNSSVGKLFGKFIK